MNLLALFKSWKDFNFAWTIIEPFVIKLIKKNVPNKITKLYEDVPKTHQPLLNSLNKLKNKIKETPNKIDDECFEIGVSALEKYHEYLGEEIKKLRS